MPAVRNATWYGRFFDGRPTDTPIHPEFLGYMANAEPSSAVETAQALREAFAFLRRHGNRRYSPNSLMRILTHADRLEAAASGALPVGEDNPRVVLAKTPFTFDPQTEVKTGGVLAACVIMPDNRMMLAVNESKRRIKVGTATLQFVTQYLHTRPTLWVHRGNLEGQHFCLANGMQAWSFNNAGAMEFAARQPNADSDAVEYAEDYAIDEALEMRDSYVRPRRSRSANARTIEGVQRAARALDEIASDPALERLLVEEEAIQRRQRPSSSGDCGGTWATVAVNPQYTVSTPPWETTTHSVEWHDQDSDADVAYDEDEY